MHKLLARIWRVLGGWLQWRALWLFHAKFIIGVSAIIVDESGRVLLLRHRYWKAGTWGLPSGYAIRGETLEQTVQREIKEETNLDVDVSRLLQIKSGFKLRIEATFVGNVNGGTLEINRDEILEAGFFSIDALPNGLLLSHRELLKAFSA